MGNNIVPFVNEDIGAPECVKVPTNIEAEAALLGAMMNIDMGWLIEYTADRLTSSSFYEPVHSLIFEAIQQQHALGKSANPILIKGHVEGDPGFNELGGLRYLGELTANQSGLFAPQDLVAQVLDLSNRRKIMAALGDAYTQCNDLGVDVADIVSRVDSAIDQRTHETIIESDAAECMASALAELDAEHVGVINERISVLDDLIGALEPKSLTILAARPGMGKTALAVSYVLGAARAGHGTCFVSLEMSREQLSHRMIADVGFDYRDRRIPYSALQKRSLNPQQRDFAEEIARWIGKLPLSVIDAGTLTMGRLDRLIRRQKRRMAAKGHKLELVVVDYLQLLHPDERRRSAYEAISEISTRLKAIAKDQGVAILALAQLSRVVEQRADKRPILSDLRDSGQIEQDADAVLFLLREEYYLHQSEPQNDPDAHEKWQASVERCQGVIEFILAKRRNGTTGTATARFFGAYQAVRNTL